MHITPDTIANTTDTQTPPRWQPWEDGVRVNGELTDAEKNPPLALAIVGDSNGVPSWRVKSSVNANIITLNSQTLDRTSSGGVVQLGVWTDWVVQARYHMTTGYLRAWKKLATESNFVQVANHTGGYGYAGINPTYIKIGWYQPIWDNDPYVTTVDINNNVVETVEVFHDSFRWYSGNDGSIDHVRPR